MACNQGATAPIWYYFYTRNVGVFANAQIVSSEPDTGTTAVGRPQATVEMSDSIDPGHFSIPAGLAVPAVTPTSSGCGSSQYPLESTTVEATDAIFDLPSSNQAQPSKTLVTGKHQLKARSRVHLNRAMGVEPMDKRSVQARRKEVSLYCQQQCGFTLDTRSTQWSEATWDPLVNAVYQEFQQRYAWTRATCEEVMKTICLDTSRNRRSSLRKVAKEATTELPPARDQKNTATPRRRAILCLPYQSKLVSRVDGNSGDEPISDDDLYTHAHRRPVSAAVQATTTVSTPQSSPLIPPNGGLRSVTPDSVDEHVTSSAHTLAAIQKDQPTAVHVMSQPTRILAKNLNEALDALLESLANPVGKYRTSQSVVLLVCSDVL